MTVTARREREVKHTYGQILVPNFIFIAIQIIFFTGKPELPNDFPSRILILYPVRVNINEIDGIIYTLPLSLKQTLKY